MEQRDNRTNGKQDKEKRDQRTKRQRTTGQKDNRTKVGEGDKVSTLHRKKGQWENMAAGQNAK